MTDSALSAPEETNPPAVETPAWAEPLQRAFTVDSSGRVVSGTGTAGVLGYLLFIGLGIASMVVQFYVESGWASVIGMGAGLAFLALAVVFNKGATMGEIDFIKRRFLVPSNAVTPGGVPLLPIAFAELVDIEIEDRGKKRVYILRGRDREILMELVQRDNALSTDEVKAALSEALDFAPKGS